MTLTHAKLLDAVRAAGRDRESFTCADVRQQLGLSTGDRKQLSRFYSRFRALQKAAADEIEKLGKDAYRLRVTLAEPAVAVEAAPEPIEQLAVLTREVAVEAVIARALEVASPAEDVARQQVQVDADSLARADAHEAVATLLAQEPDAESVRVSAADAGEPAVTLAAASKPRAPWLSRMVSFFSRRPKNDVASGVAVSA